MSRLALVLALLLSACAHVRPAASRPQPDLDARLADVEALLGRCQVQGVYALCERPALITALTGCAELYRAAGLCRADLEQCRQLGGLDLAVERGKVAAAEEKAQRYQWQRWAWGAVGLVLGAALGVGIAAGVSLH